MNSETAIIITLTAITLAALIAANIAVEECNRISRIPTAAQLYDYYKAHAERIGESWEDFTASWGSKPLAEIKQKYGQ